MTQNNDSDQDDISWFPYILAVTSIVIIGIVVLSINQQNAPAPKPTVVANNKSTKTAQNLSDITVKILTKAGSNPEKISFPHEIKSNLDDGRLEYNFTLNHKAEAKTIYNIVADDCVEKFEINGKPVDVEGQYQQNRCNWQYGFNIDLKPYLAAGANKVLIEVKNGRGPTGLTVNTK